MPGDKDDALHNGVADDGLPPSMKNRTTESVSLAGVTSTSEELKKVTFDKSPHVETYTDTMEVSEMTKTNFYTGPTDNVVLRTFRNALTSIWEFITALAAFLLLLVLLPVLLPLSLSFRIYRRVDEQIIRYKTNGEAAVIKGVDSIWLQDTPNNRAIINAILAAKGQGDVIKWREILLKKFVLAKNDHGEILFPKLREYPTTLLHRYIWMPEKDFDIANHVYMYDGLPLKNKKDLEECVGKLSQRAFKKRQAQWEVIVIPPTKDAGGTYYALFRAHHSIADGISFVRAFLQNLVDNPLKEEETKRYASTVSKTWFTIAAIFFGPKLALQRLAAVGDHSCLHGREMSGVKLVTWSDPISLALVKKIKNATKTTVNDVLMSCMAGAFTDYFASRKEIPPTHLLTTIPVALQAASEEISLENRFSLVFLRLPTSISDDIERLRVTKQRMDAIKRTPEPLVNEFLIRYSMSRLPGSLTRRLFDGLGRKSSMILSNVPGPQHHIQIAGSEVTMMTFWPPQRANGSLLPQRS
ncbi:uncharacterized protein LOC106170404 [Lingula anatina]|uniref:Uncharacterized protein LOC106170404 n=1 Tax=Lingula anatina TaxID=7574 RepID=A0A1S3J5X4_LINAN|nr:uncharacterized protein LOC106170404 [Lingula anatina]|eukprot:XP_013405708.1 uncharacterized protein LOC106170404 [Lingula anatina]